MDYLPMTTYTSPPRQVRGMRLNTIMEDIEETDFGRRSDSENDTSDGTIVGKPVGGESRYFYAAPKKSRLAANTFPSSPSTDCSSSCGSAESGHRRQSTHSSSDGSDDGTIFSDMCPSLVGSAASDPTTIATDSSRNSITSTKTNRNRYPGILIPRTDSWHSVSSPYKDAAVQMSPLPKISLSPAVLSALPKWVPAINAPPSLGDGSSVTSESSSMPALSAPVTPVMGVVRVVDGEDWSSHAQDRRGRTPISASPHEDDFHQASEDSVIIETEPETDWSEIVGKFPRIPGATPEEYSPLTPDIRGMLVFPEPSSSDVGVRLPPEALKTLENLVREGTPSFTDDSSSERQEMQELSRPPSRPRSTDGVTPLSDYSGYSFSQLSIPSPGGFFSSLKAGSRHTWCLGQSKSSNPPSSTTAENFYNVPWRQPEQVVETVLEVEDTNLTEGPPTAKQPVFDPPAAPKSRANSFTSEGPDLYGPSIPVLNTAASRAREIRHEYEEAYDEELKNAGEANLDRTSTWLAAQTTYMSVLRESNPVNDLLDLSIPVNHPNSATLGFTATPTEDTPCSKKITVHFMLGSTRSTPLVPSRDSSRSKDPTLDNALAHHLATSRRLDSFLQATVRLDLLHSLRLTNPVQHVARYLLGNFDLATTLTHPVRPKYSGPFSQNPRQTGIFDLTPAQAAFQKCQREQLAINAALPNTWTVEALRFLYSGRLFASPAIGRRLDSKATLPLNDPACMGKKRIRVLDLGGTTSCDWGWHVAHQYSNVKVYTVVTKSQAEAQLRTSLGAPPPAPVTPGSLHCSIDPNARIQGPPNHRTVSVPQLYNLPFPRNHFDVVSARSLHALLKSHPVPGNNNIDEYDMCLKEVMRVLKPGGWFEFLLMDSTIVPRSMTGAVEGCIKEATTNENSSATAGSTSASTNPSTETARCDALSVEFGYQLKMRGYEREATRSWLPRLKKRGFVGVKRAWWLCPMGNPMGPTVGDRRKAQASHGKCGGRDGGVTWKEAPRPMSEVSVRRILDEYLDVEAVRGPVGSTSEIADVTGLLGTHMWETWVVKVRREQGREEGRWLEGIGECVEEGRMNGAGFRMLSGWGRKPARMSEMTEIGSSALEGLKRGAEMGTIRIQIQDC